MWDNDYDNNLTYINTHIPYVNNDILLTSLAVNPSVTQRRAKMQKTVTPESYSEYKLWNRWQWLLCIIKLNVFDFKANYVKEVRHSVCNKNVAQWI